jgi:hypothetical protein
MRLQVQHRRFNRIGCVDTSDEIKFSVNLIKTHKISHVTSRLPVLHRLTLLRGTLRRYLSRRQRVTKGLNPMWEAPLGTGTSTRKIRS